MHAHHFWCFILLQGVIPPHPFSRRERKVHGSHGKVTQKWQMPFSVSKRTLPKELRLILKSSRFLSASLLSCMTKAAQTKDDMNYCRKEMFSKRVGVWRTYYALRMLYCNILKEQTSKQVFGPKVMCLHLMCFPQRNEVGPWKMISGSLSGWLNLKLKLNCTISVHVSLKNGLQLIYLCKYIFLESIYIDTINCVSINVFIRCCYMLSLLTLQSFVVLKSKWFTVISNSELDKFVPIMYHWNDETMGKSIFGRLFRMNDTLYNACFFHF